MDASEFGVLASYAGTGTALLLAAALVWIAFKTRSWHPIRYRLWLLVNGKNKVTDKAVGKTLQDEADLTAFRFFFMDADSLYEAKTLIAWGESKCVSMSMLSACGGYFLRKKLALKQGLPRLKPVSMAVGIAGGLGIWLVAFIVFGMLSSSAILKFKDSGQWFLLAPHEARTLFVRNPVSVSDLACRASQGHPTSSFSAEDGQTLCKMFADPKLDGYVRNTVHEQRIALGLLIGMLLFFLAQIYGAQLRLKAAWRVKEQLENEERAAVATRKVAVMDSRLPLCTIPS